MVSKNLIEHFIHLCLCNKILMKALWEAGYKILWNAKIGKEKSQEL